MVQISRSFWEAPQRLALTEQADVDLLQGVDAAELVELVVNLVEDQSFVVICGEVLHDVVNCGGENEVNVERLSRGAQHACVHAGASPDGRGADRRG